MTEDLFSWLFKTTKLYFAPPSFVHFLPLGNGLKPIGGAYPENAQKLKNKCQKFHQGQNLILDSNLHQMPTPSPFHQLCSEAPSFTHSLIQ